MDEMGKGDKAAETKTATYTYDPFNQLTGYKTMSGVNASYGYYAGGLRSSKTVNGITTGYYYDGMNVINEVKNGELSVNLYGATGYISRKTGDNTPNYFLYNIHTDVTQLANENGTVIKNYDYDAWGTPTKDDGAQIDNPIRYAGEYFDDESGMIYLRARYYQPEVGRFISEDPAKDGMNWYGYCAGNPVNYIDFTGCSYVPIKIFGRNYGVSWDSESKTATVGGHKFYIGDGIGTFIQGGTMYVWDSWALDRMGQNPSIYSNNPSENYSFTQMAIDTDGASSSYGSSSHQSQTSLQIKGNDGKMYSVDASKTNYVVIPKDYNGNAKLGDIAILVDNNTGKFVYCIIADKGPNGKYQEVSIAAARNLGYSNASGTSGPSGDFTFILIPNSKIDWKASNLQSQIDEEGKKYYVAQ